MTISLFVSHAAGDAELAGNWVDVIEGALPDVTVACSSLPGYAASKAASEPPVCAGADVVVGLLTPASMQGGRVPFELGAASVSGQSLLLVLQEGLDAAALELPLEAEHVMEVRSREDALGVAAELAERLGRDLVYGDELQAALVELVPPQEGRERYSDVSGVRETQLQTQVPGPGQGVATPTVAQAREGVAGRGLPTCAASLNAGRAFADCSFNRDQGCVAAELDIPFGPFVAALGGQWGQLRDLNDPDLWGEVVENLLSGLGRQEAHVRAFYDAGAALSNVLNVVEHEPGEDPAARAEHDEVFEQTSDELAQALRGIGLDSADCTRMRIMLENLVGPEAERDYTFVARLQARIREQADSCDADLAA